MNDLTSKLKDVIKVALKDAFNLENQDSIIAIEIPKEKTHGDYSSNIAMRLARVLHKSPSEIANILKVELEKSSLITKVEVAGHCFINLFINQDSITKVIKDILTLK
mgnify:FL=1